MQQALFFFLRGKKGHFVFILMKGYSYCLQLSWLGCLFKPKAACAGIRTTVPAPLSSNAKSLNGSWARATSTTPCGLKSSTIYIQSLKSSQPLERKLWVRTMFFPPQERNKNIPLEGPCEISWLLKRNHDSICPWETYINILCSNQNL